MLPEALDRHEPDSQALPDVFRHYVGEVVYGANDGLITTFTVVSGVAGAGLAPAVVLILGFVNLLADGFSMGASSYLAIRSSSAAHGLSRGVLEPLAHAGATFGAFVLVGAIPLLAFLVLDAAGGAFPLSAALTGLALFAVGASRSWVTPKGWLRCGLEMLGIGLVAAAVAYGVGSLLGRWVPR
jgi:VIT1/CCC1 family predicted Fe2+/Mn2+ transporter